MTPTEIDKLVEEIYERKETEVIREFPLDLNTLAAVHNYIEFQNKGWLDLDAWLHAHIKKALRLREGDAISNDKS